MIIRTSGKKYQFNDFFKNYEELKVFIKSKNEFINTDFFDKKIKSIYNDLLKSNEIKKLSIFDWFVYNKFNFKHKSAHKLDFWEERGYSINEYIIWLKKRRNNVELSELLNENENKFKYGIYKFKKIGKIYCRLCNSEVIYKLMGDTYHIIKCKNGNCQSNLHKEIDTIRQLAFLPHDIFIKKNKRIDIESTTQKEYWLLKKYSLENTILKINEIKKELKTIPLNTPKYYMILKGLNYEDAKKYISSNSIYSTEYWIKMGLNKNESIKKVKEIQTKNSNLFANKKKLYPEKYCGILTTQIKYWINKGFNEKTAIEIIKERQKTFSLDKCIKKYGKINGISEYNKRQNNWQNSLNKNGKLKYGFSKISQELFYLLLDVYDINKKINIMFATHNNELRLPKENGGIWLYDFADIENKKIIEYNGDMYHANPKKYKENDFPHPFRKNITSKELWEKDKLKINCAKKNGYDVLVVWDSEYRWGKKEKVVEKCLKFLNK